MNRCDKQNTYAQTGQYKASRCDCPSRCKSRCLLFGQAGFTILEVLVAAVVLAVGLAAIAGMQTHSIGQASFSDQISMRVSAITHRAESLKRMPVLEDEVIIDDTRKIDVEVSSMFKEENMCDYGEACNWSYVDYENENPHTVRQRVTLGYPLPNMIMIELEAIPKRVDTETTERRTVRLAYVRSRRWN